MAELQSGRGRSMVSETEGARRSQLTKILPAGHVRELEPRGNDAR